MAVWAVVVVFVKVPVILAALVPGTPPVNPTGTLGANQVYFVPAGTVPLTGSTGVTVKEAPLQMDVVIAEITGCILVVTVTVLVFTHPLAEVPVTV